MAVVGMQETGFMRGSGINLNHQRHDATVKVSLEDE